VRTEKKNTVQHDGGAGCGVRGAADSAALRSTQPIWGGAATPGPSDLHRFISESRCLSLPCRAGRFHNVWLPQAV
jgi:hypothetical protein